MVAVFVQEVGYFLHIDRVVEGRRVTNLSLVGRHFALQTLDQVTNCHPTGYGVWVDDDVGGDAFTRERHVLQKHPVTYTGTQIKDQSPFSCWRIFLRIPVHHGTSRHRTKTYLLPISNPTGSFLTVSTGEFVSNLRSFGCANSDFAELVALLIDGHHHLVYDTRLSSAHEHTGVSLRESLGCSFKLCTKTKPHFQGIIFSVTSLQRSNLWKDKRQQFTSSSFSGRVMVLPMRTSSPDTLVPGAMMPSSSNLSYTALLIPSNNVQSTFCIFLEITNGEGRNRSRHSRGK